MLCFGGPPIQCRTEQQLIGGQDHDQREWHDCTEDDAANEPPTTGQQRIRQSGAIVTALPPEILYS